MKERKKGNNNPTVVFNRGNEGGCSVFMAVEKYFVESVCATPRTETHTFIHLSAGQVSHFLNM